MKKIIDILKERRTCLICGIFIDGENSSIEYPFLCDSHARHLDILALILDFDIEDFDLMNSYHVENEKGLNL
jgi:hypothetical protein